MTTDTDRLYWTSEDGQGSIDMGTMANFAADDRAAAEQLALRELLDQCSSAEQRDGIWAGSMAWS